MFKGEGDFTVFWIKVSLRQSTYRIPRRFREFFDLYTHLRTVKGIDFSGFPKKTFLKVRSEDIISQRMNALDKYMKFLHSQNKEKKIIEFLHFLEVQEVMTYHYKFVTE